MAKQSPGYPSFALPKAIGMARQIHAQDRTNPIDREVAAKHIGYSGLSGASEKALSTLAHYGLTEKTGKGQVRLSRLAIEILFPDPVDPSAQKRAIHEAAARPRVFRDLQERFPGGHVSEAALESYLRRENFLDRAINPVSHSFLETCRYAEQMGASESHGNEASDGAESDPQDEMREPETMQTTTIDRTPAAPPAATFAAPAPPPAGLNQINMDIRGDQVLVSGLLDMKGLSLLEKKIAALKVLLTVYTEANDTGGSEDDS